MKFKINLRSYPGAEYFTVHEHLRRFSSAGNKMPDLGTDTLQKNLRALFNISDEFKFNILNISIKKQLFETQGANLKVIVKDDPVLGIETSCDCRQSSVKLFLLDLSYSFPQLVQDYSNYDYLVIDPNASLGIPVDFLLLFYRTDSPELMDAFDELSGAEYQEQTYLLHQVLSDYLSKGMEMLVRESNYKAVVLHQVIENSSFLKRVTDKNSRSKTMISAECETSFLKNIDKLGYEVEVYTKDGKSYLTIANYPTHSKETIEMFSDRILNT